MVRGDARRCHNSSSGLCVQCKEEGHDGERTLPSTCAACENMPSCSIYTLCVYSVYVYLVCVYSVYMTWRRHQYTCNACTLPVCALARVDKDRMSISRVPIYLPTKMRFRGRRIYAFVVDARGAGGGVFSFVFCFSPSLRRLYYIGGV